MNIEPIKIGRVNRLVERTLGISLNGDVNVYVKEDYVASIAKARPTEYLHFLEELTDILKKPDFVSFHIENETFIYAKTFIKDGAVVLVCIKVKREGHVFYFEKIFKGGRMILLPELSNAKLLRALDKRIPESAGNN